MYGEDVYTRFVDLRKYATEFVMKNFGGCCESTVLQPACYGCQIIPLLLGRWRL